MTTNKTSLRTCFCERFDCPDSEYEERALTQCLYLHARCLAPVVRLFNPSFFDQDFQLLRRLGNAMGRREASIEIHRFHDSNLEGGLFRTGMRIRVSGRKAGRLARKLFRREPCEVGTPVLARS